MKLHAVLIAVAAVFSPLARAGEDYFDRIDDALTFGSSDGEFRARLSGTLDLEGYHFTQPAIGVIDAEGSNLFNPRLTTFLDAQLGPRIYAFAQARVDRGFDPGVDNLQARLDEYALRFTPWMDGRLNVQIGKFATVVGNWVPRHGSWDNPFVTAPLPYENLTGNCDAVAANSAGMLLAWAHVRPRLATAGPADDKYLRIPIIWGPSYSRGLAVSGQVDRLSYDVEMKGTSLSSRPSTWDDGGFDWRHPTVSARLAYRPDEMWTLGVSASDGPYLKPSAQPTVPTGFERADYREVVLAQDIGFAWHHIQLWGEVFEARFAIPRIGNVDTLAYYVEAKYKFTPQFFGALRWNEQQFGDVTLLSGDRLPWSGNVWRIDVAPGYRFTPQTQLKLQYSLQHDEIAPRTYSQLVALQFVLRF